MATPPPWSSSASSKRGRRGYARLGCRFSCKVSLLCVAQEVDGDIGYILISGSEW